MAALHKAFVRLSFALVIVPCAVVSACREHDTLSSAAVRVDTVAGVETITVTGEPPAASITPLFDVGGDAFGSIASVVADDAGNVYVADRLRKTIDVFDSIGERVRSIGREGSGPGEYRNPASLALLGDTLAVYDADNLRIGLFSVTRDWLGSWPLRPANGSWTQTTSHEAWSRTVRWRGPKYDHVYIRHTAAGASDTMPYRLAQPPSSEPANRVDCEMADGSIAIFSASAPFVTWSVMQPIPGGVLAESDPSLYQITFTTDGDTTRVLRYLSSDTLIGSAEWSREEALWEGFRSANPGGRCSSSFSKPSRKRLIAGFMSGPESTLWITRTASPEDSVVRIDVFGADGNLVRALMVPRHKLAHARGDRLYLVTRDSLDVESLHAFRVTMQ